VVPPQAAAAAWSYPVTQTHHRRQSSHGTRTSASGVEPPHSGGHSTTGPQTYVRDRTRMSSSTSRALIGAGSVREPTETPSVSRSTVDRIEVASRSSSAARGVSAADPPSNAGAAPLFARLNGTAERLRAGVSSHAGACSKSELDFRFNEMLTAARGCKHPPPGECRSQAKWSPRGREA
jgi:hypothetical protein